jgi:hypothetical protein
MFRRCNNYLFNDRFAEVGREASRLGARESMQSIGMQRERSEIGEDGGKKARGVSIARFAW